VCTGSFGWMPEFVVSGINPGLNTGRVVLHSGTVGAALTAASCDITGLAISTATENAEALATAGVLAAWLVDLVAQREFGPAALSLNVPALSLPHVDGVSDAQLSDIGISDVSFDINHDVLHVRRKENSPPFEDGTDAYLLSQGWAALSAIASPWASAPDASGLANALHHRLI